MKNRLYQLGCLLTLLLVSAAAHAQTIRGTVTADDGEPLIGVTVAVKGTDRGTSTDINGNFEIEAQQGDELVLTYVGFQTQEITVSGTGINIVLQEGTLLDEVVVVGYGTQKRGDVAGAVSVADREDFEGIATTNTQQLIQGRLAGVQVVNGSGLPGSGTNIVIRGTGSFTSVNPLYVIDGIQASATLFNSLSANDVESITVLKDAASTAIYGAQGANGVVIVTTKRATTGEPRVSFNSYIGFARATNLLDLTNADQYVDLSLDILEATGGEVAPAFNDPASREDVTDWQEEMFGNTATQQEHYLNVAGGTTAMTYNVSGSFLDQDYIAGDYNYRRLNFRVGLTEKIGSRIRLGQNITFNQDRFTGGTPDVVGGLRSPTYKPVFDDTNIGGFSTFTTPVDGTDPFNPLTGFSTRDNRNITNRTYFQGYAELDILDNLTFRSQGALEYSSFGGFSFQRANENGNLFNPTTITESQGTFFAPILENTLTFTEELGDHGINILVGNTWQDDVRFRNIRVRGSDFVNEEIASVALAGTTSLEAGTGTSGGAQLSYFGRINYDFMDKYLLTASLRADGRPVFPEDERFGYFPSVGVAWKMHEESFLADNDLISSLKVRASWGITGNANIADFAEQSLVYRGDGVNNITYSTGLTPTFTPGATVARAPAPGLRWEETTQTDLGVELSLFDYALNVELGYYNRDNDGLLVSVPIPPSTGFGGAYDNTGTILANAASATNSGFEATIGYNGSIGDDINYYVNFNGAWNDNEVTSLGAMDASPINGGGFEAVSSSTRTDVGQPIGSFYGYQTLGIANQADVDRLNAGLPDGTTYQDNFLPGDIIFADLNGDGVVTSDDQDYLGSPIPEFTYGGALGFAFRGLDFSAAFQGVSGVTILNSTKYWLEGMIRPFNASATVLDRWTPENMDGSLPAAGQNATADLNLRMSDRYLEDGSYFRMRNITLGYSLPESLTDGWASNIRAYVTVQNAFTVTDYSGYDPEVSSNGSFLFARGIDGYRLPAPRTFLFGIQAGF